MKTRLKHYQQAIDAVVKQEVDSLNEWYLSMKVEAVVCCVVLFGILCWVLIP